jgi:hypothetical protein
MIRVHAAPRTNTRIEIEWRFDWYPGKRLFFADIFIIQAIAGRCGKFGSRIEKLGKGK